MQIWWYVIKWICQYVNRLCYIGVYWSTIWYCIFLESRFLSNTSNTFHSKFCEMFVWQVFIIAEHLFCTYFLVEWCVRFGAFENKRHWAAQIFEIFSPFIESLDWHFTKDISGDCLRDFWLLFDGLLMFVTVFELGTSGWWCVFFGFWMVITGNFWGLGWCNSSYGRSGSEGIFHHGFPTKLLLHILWRKIQIFQTCLICHLNLRQLFKLLHNGPNRGGQRWRKVRQHGPDSPGPPLAHRPHRTHRQEFPWESRDWKSLFRCHIPPWPLHSRRLRKNLKLVNWKIIFLFQGRILRFHVDLPGCNIHDHAWSACCSLKGY